MPRVPFSGSTPSLCSLGAGRAAGLAYIALYVRLMGTGAGQGGGGAFLFSYPAFCLLYPAGRLLLCVCALSLALLLGLSLSRTPSRGTGGALLCMRLRPTSAPLYEVVRSRGRRERRRQGAQAAPSLHGASLHGMALLFSRCLLLPCRAVSSSLAAALIALGCVIAALPSGRVYTVQAGNGAGAFLPATFSSRWRNGQDVGTDVWRGTGFVRRRRDFFGTDGGGRGGGRFGSRRPPRQRRRPATGMGTFWRP